MTIYTKMIVAAVTACASVSFGAQVLKFDSANYINPTAEPWLGTWSDTSGLANNAKSPNSWNRATVIGATPTGQPSLKGDNNFNLLLATPVKLTDFTVVTVLKTASYGGDQTIFGGPNGAMALRVDGADTGNGRLTFTKVGQWDPVTSTGPLTTGVWHVLSMTYGLDAITMRIDGVAQVLGSKAYLAGVDGFGPILSIGNSTGNYAFQGELAAVYMYDTVLDQTSLTTVENGLTATYVGVPEPTMLSFLGLTAMGLIRRRSR